MIELIGLVDFVDLTLGVVVSQIMSEIALVHELFKNRSMNWNITWIYQLWRSLWFVDTTNNLRRFQSFSFLYLFLFHSLKRFLKFGIISKIDSHMLRSNHILTHIVVLSFISNIRLCISDWRWMIVWVGMNKIQER